MRTMVTGLRHELFLYTRFSDLVEICVSILRQASEDDEPVLVALASDRLEAVRDALNGGPGNVEFADMAELGQNPARIISAWHDFFARHAEEDRPIVGIGESVWEGRPSPEVAECFLHEALCNVAFARASEFRAICPYDASALDPPVIEHARRTHPLVLDADGPVPNPEFRPDQHRALFEEPLPEPPVDPETAEFDLRSLDRLRRTVSETAIDAGLEPIRADHVLFAVNEAAENSVRHGGGRALLRHWREGSALVFEIRDEGRISELLAGRIPIDAAEQTRGFGLYLVNQLSELAQVRSGPWGTQVRIRVDLNST